MKKGSIQFEVVVGTYEEFVLGYQFNLDEDNGKGELNQAFATHSHRASVRAVACHGKLVVSGGADETINIYNMFTRKECGMLMEHNGTITSLNFTPDGSHVISTSEDGTIKIFRQGSWQLEKVWPNAHKGTAVTSLSVHPSGKMALSVGKDHTLRTWNLVKGRPAYTTNLYSRCRQLELVMWSPEGMLFAIPMDTKVEITSTQKAGVLHTLELPSKVTACVFLSEEVLCVGEASGTVTAFHTDSATLMWSLAGHERIRGLACLHGYLVTAISGGHINVYGPPSLTALPRLITSTDCGCRITCLTLYDYKSEIKVKKEKLEESKSIDKKSLNGVSKKRSLSQLNEILETDEKRNKNQTRTSSESQETDILSENYEQRNANKKRKSSSEFQETDIFSESHEQRNENKKRKSSSIFQETSVAKTPDNLTHKKTKNQKTNEVVVCSPRTQKWIVEDSKR